MAASSEREDAYCRAVQRRVDILIARTLAQGAALGLGEGAARGLLAGVMIGPEGLQ